ncbi:MAG TPA: hypothetical protein PK683_21975, partial [Leptospiraceae bacterium]|nr:hypothetical protein [Leptospiraceae bacterium]
MKKICIIIITLFLLIHCGESFRPIRNVPEKAKKVVLFLDFENNSIGSGKDNWDGLRRAIPSMILTDFKNFGTYRPVTEDARLSALKELKRVQQGILEDRGIQAGKLASADFILSGNFMEISSSIAITAKLTDVQTGEAVSSSSQQGHVDSILNPPEKSLIKKTSITLLSQTQYNPTTNEIQMIADVIETKKIQAAGKNYEGEIIMDDVALLKKSGKSAESQEVKSLEEKANWKFKSAVSEDPSYERAKQNMEATVSLLPP